MEAMPQPTTRTQRGRVRRRAQVPDMGMMTVHVSSFLARRCSLNTLGERRYAGLIVADIGATSRITSALGSGEPGMPAHRQRGAVGGMVAVSPLVIQLRAETGSCPDG